MTASRDVASAALAKAASATAWIELPEPVQHQVEDLFLDTLAVVAAGMTHPGYRAFAKAMAEGAGGATVLGMGQRFPPLVATMLNGGATTVHQLQDIHRLGRSHPASHIVPAIFALGEERGASAEQLFTAFTAGYETGARVGIALGGLQDQLHDAGTWGTIAAAAAAAHLITGGDADKIAAAIDAAAAVALFPYRETPMAGATIHHLYIGLGAGIGVTVGKAVAAGLTALPGTLEDFFGPRAGQAFDANKLTAGIGANGRWSHFELLNAHFKVHSVCGHIATVMDALMKLISSQRIGGAEVKGVDIAIYATALQYNTAEPANDLAARFSISTMAALALIHGPAYATRMTDGDLAAPAVRDLAARVNVRHAPALDAEYPKGRPVIVTLELFDGRALSEKAVFPRGDVTNPIDRGERRLKARTLLDQAYPGRAGAIVAAFDGFVAGGPITALSAALGSEIVR